ncbi:hypothetical protein [Aeromonas cavernicola]|uniref:Peptidase S1 domain-containing protein n=1 Tax=Aeromonas cavernicola TaxID=1006623 RepID=A0A2H9U9G3_9GAMM|nr:hypothetical protein [Aeromonas cavernicola]PJG60664.1 hypothetical protein CUC53_01300 [Aeromonas cavernicola]
MTSIAASTILAVFSSGLAYAAPAYENVQVSSTIRNHSAGGINYAPSLVECNGTVIAPDRVVLLASCLARAGADREKTWITLPNGQRFYAPITLPADHLFYNSPSYNPYQVFDDVTVTVNPEYQAAAKSDENNIAVIKLPAGSVTPQYPVYDAQRVAEQALQPADRVSLAYKQYYDSRALSFERYVITNSTETSIRFAKFCTAADLGIVEAPEDYCEGPRYVRSNTESYGIYTGNNATNRLLVGLRSNTGNNAEASAVLLAPYAEWLEEQLAP